MNTSQPSEKLEHRKLGPFKILEKIGEQAVRLRLDPGMKIHDVFHIALLEPHRPDVFDRKTEPLLPIIIDGQEEWEVEKILNHRVRWKRDEYLIKWKGLKDHKASWEPLKTMFAPKLIEAYHRKYPKKEKAKKKGKK